MKIRYIFRILKHCSNVFLWLANFFVDPLDNAFSKNPKIVFPECQSGLVFFSKFYSMSLSKVCYISRAGPRAGTMRLSLWHLCRVLSTFPQPPLAITTPQQPLPHNTCRSIVQTFPSDPVAYVQSSSIPGLHHELLILSSTLWLLMSWGYLPLTEQLLQGSF